jgi:CNT family concentrative nucleoside transporter
VLAFRALPLVLIIAALSALSSMGHPAGACPHVAWLLTLMESWRGRRIGRRQRVRRMVEARWSSRPYLARLSRGELFIVMNCGMATIAGTVLVLYATLLVPVLPDALAHLLVASIVATPVAIAVAALMVPPAMTDDAVLKFERKDASAVAAITRGTLEGLQLLLNIVAMLIVFVAPSRLSIPARPLPASEAGR